MPLIQEYSKYLLKEIQKNGQRVALMEVCGTHTMAVARSGLRNLLPDHLRLISGPGCPVCVTAEGDIDAVIKLAGEPGVTLTTFGDMIRVPGSESSLQKERGRGADIRVVYSPRDALRLAVENPNREVVFLGIGFETTAPVVAATIIEAAEREVKNFSVWSLHKTVPPALEAIFSDREIKVDGLICPGHVAAVTGIEPYDRLASRYLKPCVVTGFETVDILEGIYMLLSQLMAGSFAAEIQYRRVVKPQGNIVAQNTMNRVFEPVDSRWRGIGVIEGSGLKVREEFGQFDARKRFDIPEFEDKPLKGCACGEVLKGRITPHQCPLFGERCTPSDPVGPCMVSSEGACAAYYRYSL